MEASSVLLIAGTIGIFGIFVTLLSVMMLLSILRQRRSQRRYEAEKTISRRPVDVPAISNPLVAPPEVVARPEATRPTAAIRKTIELVEKLPVREGTADDVNIQITAPDGPNNEQRNVQRLIDFLKREATQSA